MRAFIVLFSFVAYAVFLMGGPSAAVKRVHVSYAVLTGQPESSVR